SWTDIGDELVLFDSSRGNYHALNGSASAIWRALCAAGSADAIVARLCETYGADRDRIAADVDAFLVRALASALVARTAWAPSAEWFTQTAAPSTPRCSRRWPARRPISALTGSIPGARVLPGCCGSRLPPRRKLHAKCSHASIGNRAA